MATTTRVKTWISGDTLTASDLNTEFNNLLTGGINNIQDANVAAGAAIGEAKLAFNGSGHGHTGGTDGKLVSSTNNYTYYEVESPTYTTTSTNFVDIDGTNLKRTITPTSVNSKIKITFTGTFSATGSATINFKFVRNPSGTPVTLMLSVIIPSASSNQVYTIVGIDAPATVAATVYDCQWKVDQGTGQVGNGAYGVSFLVEELKS